MDKELRILIIEDSPADTELEEHELRKAGLVFTSKVVHTKEAFLKALDEFLPDLILSDYDLPTFDGLAALRIVQEKCPDVPFILVTGKLGEEFVIDKLKDGASDYILKGNLKRLVPSVNRALEEAKLKTERKNAEEDFTQIFSMSLDMICIANINTATFLKVNPAFTKTLGYSAEELLERSFLDFIHPDDIASTRAVVEEKLQAGEKVINFENRYRCKDGSYLWLNWCSHPNTKKGVTFAVARDVTERKRNEELLQESKDLLDATGRMAKIGGWEVDAETLEVRWTEETYRIHEVPLDQKPPLEEAINFFHPEDRDKLKTAIQRALEYGEAYGMEIRFITAKGNHLWTHTTCTPQIINGKTVKLRGIFQDITERKKAEANIRDLAKFPAENPYPILRVDRDGKLLYTNKVGKKVFSKWFLQTGKTVPAVLQKAVSGSIEKGSEQVLVLELNDQIYSFSFTPIADTDYCNIYGQDITERKKAEEALRRNQAMLERTESITNVGSWEWEVATDTVTWSEELFRIFQRNPADRAPSFAEHPELYYPEDMQRLREAVEAAVSNGTPYEIELRAIRKDGTTRVCLAHGYVEMDSEKKVTHLFGSLQDITERKKAEDELRASEERYSIMTNSLPNIVLVHKGGKIHYVNASGIKILGYFRDEVVGKTISEFLTDDSKDLVAKNMQRRLAGEDVESYEAKIIAKNNEIKYFLVNASVIPYEKEPAFLVVLSEITERKQAEVALNESEERYRLILEKSFDGIFIHENFKILDLNQSMVKMTGYSRTELLGSMAIDLFTPKSKKVIQEYISSESQGSYQVEVIRKDGTIRQVESFGAPCKFQERDARIVAIRDVTEIKKAEKEIQERIKALEDFYAMAIGRELRMKELKGEIAELKEELAKYKSK